MGADSGGKPETAMSFVRDGGFIRLIPHRKGDGEDVRHIGARSVEEFSQDFLDRVVDVYGDTDQFAQFRGNDSIANLPANLHRGYLAMSRSDLDALELTPRVVIHVMREDSSEAVFVALRVVQKDGEPDGSVNITKRGQMFMNTHGDDDMLSFRVKGSNLLAKGRSLPANRDKTYKMF